MLFLCSHLIHKLKPNASFNSKTVSSTQINLTWTAPPEADASTKYMIYRYCMGTPSEYKQEGLAYKKEGITGTSWIQGQHQGRAINIMCLHIFAISGNIKNIKKKTRKIFKKPLHC